jgi:hypothetical protein
MITLTIKRQDGSTYWTEYFNSQPECDAWIAEEQTRSYWDKTYTYASVDNTPPVVLPTYAELRAASYPDFRDYLDGIVKSDQTQIQNYINACLAVKAKYPKP